MKVNDWLVFNGAWRIRIVRHINKYRGKTFFYHIDEKSFFMIVWKINLLNTLVILYRLSQSYMYVYPISSMCYKNSNETRTFVIFGPIENFYNFAKLP